MSATRAKATGITTPENQASRLSLIPPTPLSKGLVTDFFVLQDISQTCPSNASTVSPFAELQLKLARQQPLCRNALSYSLRQGQLIRITDTSSHRQIS